MRERPEWVNDIEEKGDFYFITTHENRSYMAFIRPLPNSEDTNSLELTLTFPHDDNVIIEGVVSNIRGFLKEVSSIRARTK